MEQVVKICSGCKLEKSIDSFYKRKTSSARCKECEKLYQTNFRKSKRGIYYHQVIRKTGEFRERRRVSRENHKQYMLLRSAEARAMKRNIEFNLTIEDIIIPNVCPVLGIPIVKNGLNSSKNNWASIDRIDNTKGYTKDNICVISFRANTLKSDGSIEELEKILNYMKLKLRS